MAIECERKFLVQDDQWRGSVRSSTVLKQGYVTPTGDASVRIRIKGEEAFIAIKGGRDPLNRLEFEYRIPFGDGEAILNQVCARPHIEKVRHEVATPDGLIWEIDEFDGHLSGLVLAEVELVNAHTPVCLPAWIGQEVTHDPRFLNSNLVKSGPPSPKAS